MLSTNAVAGLSYFIYSTVESLANTGTGRKTRQRKTIQRGILNLRIEQTEIPNFRILNLTRFEYPTNHINHRQFKPIVPTALMTRKD